jgi:hypothetical protein
MAQGHYSSDLLQLEPSSPTNRNRWQRSSDGSRSTLEHQIASLLLRAAKHTIQYQALIHCQVLSCPVRTSALDSGGIGHCHTATGSWRWTATPGCCSSQSRTSGSGIQMRMAARRCRWAWQVAQTVMSSLRSLVPAYDDADASACLPHKRGRHGRHALKSPDVGRRSGAGSSPAR